MRSLRTLIGVIALLLTAAFAGAAQVVFDLPSSIECREVTPEGFAQSHPALKVIEAKYRISARVLGGNPDDIVDFLYVLTSDDRTLRFQDYLPNTTLESTVADDLIEITDSAENANTTGIEAHVSYKILALGGSHNQSSKKSQCSHYKQIAARELVVASGTTNREHGVFFRLRPSLAGSLEGAKEFTFLATVPDTWRGDLCTISCRARSKKSSLLSTAVVPGGAVRARVGMYLTGDAEAAELAEELRAVQDAFSSAAHAERTKKDSVLDTLSGQAAGLFTGKQSESRWQKQRDAAAQAMLDIQQRLTNLAN